MSSSGRKKDPIWINFEELPVRPGVSGSRAVCKKCRKEIQGIVARLKKHLSDCYSESDDVSINSKLKFKDHIKKINFKGHRTVR